MSNFHEVPSQNQNNQWFEDDFDYENIPPSEMMQAVDRLQIVKNLRLAEDEHKNNVSRDDNFLEKQRLEYKETHPSPYGVTLGIEIEIPKESVLPPESENWKNTETKKYLKSLKEKYKETEKLGIPSDTDQFWEFANLPANCPTTLAREVQSLIGMGLIDEKFRKFPLHVTVGGITSETKNSDDENGTHALARILDATGWETDGERLTAPYRDTINSDWTSHGATSGIRERSPKQVVQKNGESKVHAVEFRTSEFKNLFGLERYLHSMYYLGSALKAFQNPDKSDIVVKNLTKAWKKFADQAETIFEDNGLVSPYKLWTLDTENPDEHSPFKTLAKTLNKGLKNENCKESIFIHEIRNLIIKTKAEVKDIIDSAEK